MTLLTWFLIGLVITLLCSKYSKTDAETKELLAKMKEASSSEPWLYKVMFFGATAFYTILASFLWPLVLILFTFSKSK